MIPANLHYKMSTGAVSFGASNRLTIDDNDVVGGEFPNNDELYDKQSSKLAGSMISIRDI